MTLMAALSFSIHLRAQETLNLKLDYSNARLSDVLNDFTRQTGITFSYEVTLGDMIVARLEADLKNASLETCLEAVFGHMNLTYKVDGRVVALSQPDNAVKRDGGKKNVKVTGVVSDASGLPLPGAVVMVTDGPSAMTDLDGKYTIEVASDAVLKYIMMGFKDVEENVSGRAVIDVTMTDDVLLLDEIVVVGYGTQSRKTLTTSVAKISGEKFEDVPVSTVGDAIKGKVSGLRVATSNTK